MRQILCAVFFSFLLSLTTNAQQALLTASGDAESNTGSSSYSVGQLACSSLTGTTGFILEGVQQPYEIQFFPGIEETTNGWIFKGSVYPNPTSGVVTLMMNQGNPFGFRYRLSDSRGNLLSERPVEAAQQVVPMESLPSGTYFLTVVENEILLVTYKIIKR